MKPPPRDRGIGQDALSKNTKGSVAWSASVVFSAEEGIRRRQTKEVLALHWLCSPVTRLLEWMTQNWNRMESTCGKEADSARTGPRHGCLPIPFNHPHGSFPPVRLLPVKGWMTQPFVWLHLPTQFFP